MALTNLSICMRLVSCLSPCACSQMHCSRAWTAMAPGTSPRLRLSSWLTPALQPLFKTLRSAITPNFWPCMTYFRNSSGCIQNSFCFSYLTTLLPTYGRPDASWHGQPVRTDCWDSAATRTIISENHWYWSSASCFREHQVQEALPPLVYNINVNALLSKLNLLKPYQCHNNTDNNNKKTEY